MSKEVEINPYLREKYRISRRLKTIHKLLFYICGVDLGFVRHKDRRFDFFLRLYPVIQSICIFSTGIFVKHLYWHEDRVLASVSRIAILTKYLAACVTMFILRHNMSFKHFFTEIIKIDINMKIKLESKIIFAQTALSVFGLLSFVGVSINPNRTVPIISVMPFFVIPLYNTLTRIISVIFIYYATYVRLNHLYCKLENLENEDLVPFMLSYSNLAGIIKKVDAVSSSVYSVLYLFNVPYIMIVPYVFFYVKKDQHTRRFEILHLMLLSVFELFPACFAAGMVTDKAAQISKVLQQKRLEEKPTEITRKEDYEAFIKYIQIHPFKFYLFDIIPLGWSLPLLTINFIVTYLVVILQFNHLV